MAKEAPYTGQMDRKISVFKTVTVPNEFSEHKPELVQVAQPWAKMNDVSGSQDVDGRVTSVVNRSYIIYRRAEIAKHGHTMQVHDDGVVYDVHSVRVIGRTHLELMVTAHE